MANPIENQFVVIEKDDEGNEGEEYLTPDLSKLAKKYAPYIKAGHFEERVLSLEPWTFGISVRRATKADESKFAEDTDLLSAAHEYNNMEEYAKIRRSELADTILLNAYEQVTDALALERFLTKTQLSTGQLEALNRRTSNLVNPSAEFLEIIGAYVAKKATAYKSKVTGETKKRSKAQVIEDWKRESGTVFAAAS